MQEKVLARAEVIRAVLDCIEKDDRFPSFSILDNDLETAKETAIKCAKKYCGVLSELLIRAEKGENVDNEIERYAKMIWNSNFVYQLVVDRIKEKRKLEKTVLPLPL